MSPRTDFALDGSCKTGRQGQTLIDATDEGARGMRDRALIAPQVGR